MGEVILVWKLMPDGDEDLVDIYKDEIPKDKYTYGAYEFESLHVVGDGPLGNYVYALFEDGPEAYQLINIYATEEEAEKDAKELGGIYDDGTYMVKSEADYDYIEYELK